MNNKLQHFGDKKPTFGSMSLPTSIDGDIAFTTTIIIMQDPETPYTMEDAKELRNTIAGLLNRNPRLDYHILTGLAEKR